MLPQKVPEERCRDKYSWAEYCCLSLNNSDVLKLLRIRRGKRLWSLSSRLNAELVVLMYTLRENCIEPLWKYIQKNETVTQYSTSATSKIYHVLPVSRFILDHSISRAFPLYFFAQFLKGGRVVNLYLWARIKWYVWFIVWQSYDLPTHQTYAQLTPDGGVTQVCGRS